MENGFGAQILFLDSDGFFFAMLRDQHGASGISHSGLYHLGFSGNYHQKIGWKIKQFPTF
jgi:hypothetical protein